MSEEIIEIIEEMQCIYKEQENENKYNDYTVFKAKKYSKGLQGLLDLYSKEKQKNKEHKTRIRNLECKIIRQKEQISGLRSKYHVDAWLEEDYISKDKIKAKIEEQIQTGWKTKEERWQQNYALDILQSLLEKE